MAKKQRLIIFILMALGSAPISHAETEIYKHVDKHGRVTYLNKSVKGGKKLLVNKAPAIPGATKIKQVSHRYPKVDKQTQHKRDIKRRQILENELETETKLLIYTRKVLSKVHMNAKAMKNKTKQPDRYAARYKEKVKLIQNKVRLHERNIVALKKELADL